MATSPASTGSTTPVIQRASSLARNSAAQAMSHGVLSVVMDAWMMDARDGEELWGGRITRRVRTRFEGSSYPTEQALIDVVCERLAEDLLEIMPARTPGP